MKSIQKLKHLLNHYDIVWEVTSLIFSALKYWISIKYQPDIKTGVVESDGAAVLKSLVSSPTQDWSWSR